MGNSCEIAVIGAGIIGLSCALRLARNGHEVTVIAPEDDETGASYGNAGVIADYAVLPVGTPDVLRNLPALLLDRDSPLALRPSIALAPWLLRFARESLPRRAAENTRAIAALTARAYASWRECADEIAATALLKPLGSLYLLETEADLRAVTLKPYHAHGVEAELIDRDMLGQLQPGLPEDCGMGAVFFPRTITLDDPTAMMRSLRHALESAGVTRLSARVTKLLREGRKMALHTDRGILHAAKVVLAAGAWSRELAAQIGDRVPLDTERGYHLEYDSPAPRLLRQMTPVARGFYFCPMAGRLRVAGTVELGGRDRPASPRRWEMLERGARAILPDLPAPDRHWMGCRPSLPDSRPIISPSATAGAQVIHAFGHGHLGLTLAPLTARLVAALIAGKTPEVDLTPYRVNRF